MKNFASFTPRFGGVFFLLAGVLFLSLNVLTLVLGVPPSLAQDLPDWISSKNFLIICFDELLTFAALFLIPALGSLYGKIKNKTGDSGKFGFGLLFSALPLMLVLDVVLGRLVYLVFGITLSNDSLMYSLSLFHGGMHMVALLLGSGLLLVSFTLGRSNLPKILVLLAFFAGLGQFAGAYPWLLNPLVNFALSSIFALWLLAAGFVLLVFKEPS